ncbi:MAG: VanZ family protein [Pseudomonadota bacterium]
MASLGVWLPVIACGITMFVASELPPPAWIDRRLTTFGMRLDVVCHLAGFLVMGFFTARLLARTRKEGRLECLVFTAALCTTAGVLDEGHQMFVDGRGAELIDVLSDMAGSVLGAAAYVAGGDRIRICSTGDHGRKHRGLRGALVPAALLLSLSLACGTAVYCIFGPGSRSAPTLVHGIVPGPPVSARGDGGSRAVVEPGSSVKGLRTAGRSIVGPAGGISRGWAGPASSGNMRVSQGPVLTLREDDRAYLGRLKDEMDGLEKREARMTAYHSNFVRRTILRDQVMFLKAKIANVEATRQAAPPGRDAIKSLTGWKLELAELEIKDIRLRFYAPDYPPRAILRIRIEEMRRRINMADTGIHNVEKSLGPGRSAASGSMIRAAYLRNAGRILSASQ